MLIIDCDSIVFHACHPNKKLDDNNIPLKDETGKFIYLEKSEEEVKQSVDFFMEGMLKETESTEYIAFIKGKTTFRYDINPEYKANRKERELPEHYRICKNYLIEQWKAYVVDEIEVDDAVNITRLKYNGMISAIDKDLLTLEGTHYNWKIKEYINRTAVEAYTFFWTDMITGQSGDNIKGLPGKGAVYAEKAFDKAMYVNLPAVVLNEYIQHYKDTAKGIDEFYKNFKCLHILTESPSFKIPEPVEYVLNV